MELSPADCQEKFGEQAGVCLEGEGKEPIPVGEERDDATIRVGIVREREREEGRALPSKFGSLNMAAGDCIYYRRHKYHSYHLQSQHFIPKECRMSIIHIFAKHVIAWYFGKGGIRAVLFCSVLAQLVVATLF